MGQPAPVGVTEPKVDEVQMVYLMEKAEAAHSYWGRIHTVTLAS